MFINRFIDGLGMHQKDTYQGEKEESKFHDLSIANCCMLHNLKAAN